MSCHYTELALESYYQEAIELGMTDDQAEQYARKRLEEISQ